MGRLTLPRFAPMQVKTGTPNPLLTFLAGSFAEQIASLWPSPHEAFLTLPTARRHACAMVLAGLCPGAPFEPKRLAVWLSHERDSAIADAFTDGEPSHGFMKMLSRMGEIVWEANDYRHFMALFLDPNANRVLRHMSEITPKTFSPLASLPQPLRQAGVLQFIQNDQAARDLALAHDAVLRHRPRQDAVDRITRWTRAKSQKSLFSKAAEDVYPDVFDTPTAPPDLPPPFGVVRSRGALKALALEFSNCLRDYIECVSRGHMAVYAWRGNVKAAVALTRGVGGWRLAEAEGDKNSPLDETTLKDIVQTVRSVGVFTGPSMCTLSRRLNEHAEDRCYDIIGDTYSDQLELGDLWS